MERRKIHAEGPTFSRIIAGAWRWHNAPENISELIHQALDIGITTFDHADIYGDHGNEELFGGVLRAEPGLRQRMELVTKCGIKFPSAKRPTTWVKHYDLSKAHIIWSVENSLKMLQTDHIDLLLIHRPSPLLNPLEVAEAFTTLKQNGKVLNFGVSNFTATQFEMLQSYLPFPIVTNQIEVSLTSTQPLFDGTIDVLMKHRVSPMAWSPLGGGKILSQGDINFFKKKSDYEATESQLSLAWLLKHPSLIFPVIGTTKATHLVEGAGAMNIDLDIQDWFDMLKVSMGEEMP